MIETPAGASRSERADVLVGLAWRAIKSSFEGETLLPPSPPTQASWLEEPAATFVTLKLDGRLRGCIGSLEAQRSLCDDVVANAHAAAFEDPRFSPLTPCELEELTVEVSVLSPAEPLACDTEDDLLAALRPGIDGLILRWGEHRATFLPQVWDDLPEPADFLAALKRKARLERDAWSEEMRFWRYTVEKYGQG